MEWKNDHYYLIGYSHKHKGIAHFRVDRLTSVEPLDSKFQPMPDFDVAAYTNKMVDMFAAEHSEQVKLLCSNELMRVIIDHYGEDIEISPYWFVLERPGSTARLFSGTGLHCCSTPDGALY